MPKGFLSRARSSAQSFLDPRQVGYVIFYVTNRCNFKCDFCFYADEIDKGTKPDEMTLAEIEKLAKTIGPLLQLSMTGGEPFLRNDLIEVAKVLIDNTDARYVTLPTNASLTDKMVRFLEAMLPAYPDTWFRISFSIEGIGDVHDEARSMPGSYEKIKRSYAALSPLRKKYKNLVLDCNSVYTARTEETLLGTLKVLEKDFNFDNMSITYARGTVRDAKMKDVSKNAYTEIIDFLEGIKRTKEKRFLYPVWRAVHDMARHSLMKNTFDDEFTTPCVAGRKLLVISETGEVRPCEILDKTMGNVRDFDFDLNKLLAQGENKELVKWIVESKCKCSFECALSANVVWNASNYPKLALNALRNIEFQGRGDD